MKIHEKRLLRLRSSLDDPDSQLHKDRAILPSWLRNSLRESDEKTLEKNTLEYRILEGFVSNNPFEKLLKKCSFGLSVSLLTSSMMVLMHAVGLVVILDSLSRLEEIKFGIPVLPNSWYLALAVFGLVITTVKSRKKEGALKDLSIFALTILPCVFAVSLSSLTGFIYETAGIAVWMQRLALILGYCSLMAVVWAFVKNAPKTVPSLRKCLIDDQAKPIHQQGISFKLELPAHLLCVGSLMLLIFPEDTGIPDIVVTLMATVSGLLMLATHAVSSYKVTYTGGLSEDREATGAMSIAVASTFFVSTITYIAGVISFNVFTSMMGVVEKDQFVDNMGLDLDLSRGFTHFNKDTYELTTSEWVDPEPFADVDGLNKKDIYLLESLANTMYIGLGAKLNGGSIGIDALMVTLALTTELNKDDVDAEYTALLFKHIDEYILPVMPKPQGSDAAEQFARLLDAYNEIKQGDARGYAAGNIDHAFDKEVTPMRFSALALNLIANAGKGKASNGEKGEYRQKASQKEEVNPKVILANYHLVGESIRSKVDNIQTCPLILPFNCL